MLGRLSLCAFATLVAAGLIGCTGDATSKPSARGPSAVQVDTAVASRADVQVTLDAVGTIRAIRRVEVKSETDGVVAAVHVTDGQDVAVGDLLVELDAKKLAAEVRVFEASLAAARARAANAKTALARASDLANQGFIPQQEFDDAKAKAEGLEAEVAEVQASLALRQELLNEATIVAPIAGTAGESTVDPGDFVSKGDRLVTIVALSPSEIEFTVPEEHLGALSLGQPVSVTVPSYPNELFAGEVTYIEPEILPDTRSVRLKATVPNDDRRLRPGQFASVSAVLEVRRDAILLPEEAIVPEGAENWTFIVKDGHAVRREVKIGVRRDGQVEILDGLDGSETVVINGQFRLEDGTAVKTADTEPLG